MAWDHFSERNRKSFWLELGFDEAAAEAAIRCFPESHYYDYGYRTDPRANPSQAELRAAHKAIDTAYRVPLKYRTDPKHPAYWIVQEYSFDEAASRAVTSISMVQLQREAAPPPQPPKPDRFADVAMALIMQNLVEKAAPETGEIYDEFDAPQPPRRLEGPRQPPQEPFDPDEFPRFRVK